MYEPCSSPPDREEHHDDLEQPQTKLGLHIQIDVFQPPDRSGRFQDVEVLENVGKRIESQDSETTQSNPDATENERDERWRNGKEVNESVEVEHEYQLVVRGDESHKKVSNEEHVEYEVKLKS